MKKLLLLFILHSSFFTYLCRAQIISTVAGTAKPGYNGDGIKATTASLAENGGVAVDDSGNVYIADSKNNRIRKVYKATGMIATIAGTGVAGYGGDSDKATLAQCTYPIGIRVDSLRNVYFADAGNAVIRKINTSGIISTIAGSNIGGYSGDSGLAVNAKINYPVGICLDKYLNLYIADQSNHVIRKVNVSTGIITTVAGNHIQGNMGNGGKAVKAKLNSPTGVAVDNNGNIYIADFKNNVIRMVNTSGIISIFAGNGTAVATATATTTGAAELPKSTKLISPAGVSTDAAGNIFIADAGNGVVREVLASTGKMMVIAGIYDDGFKGDGGPAVKAQISYPFDVVRGKNGDLYIADLGNNRVRKISK